jgi:hypothetical protein
MIFPIITFHSDQGGLLSLNYKHLMGCKKLVSTAFKDIKIVDALGFEYLISGVNISGGVDIWNSLRYGCKMVKYEPILKNQPKKISLSQLKLDINDQIKLNLDYWLQIDNLDEIKKSIEQARNFEELILKFK